MNNIGSISCGTQQACEISPISAALSQLDSSISRCHDALSKHENTLGQFLAVAPNTSPCKDQEELSRSPLHTRLVELRRMADGLAERIEQLTARVVA